jgi:poly(A) polymerase
VPTGKQIYDRIRWDAALDARRFTIGYEERVGGTAEIAFSAFVPDGDIPWHRLRYVRYGPTIVWDRRARVDRLGELRERLTSGGTFSG